MSDLLTKSGVLACDENLGFAYKALAFNRQSSHPDASVAATTCENTIKEILQAQAKAGRKVSFNELYASIAGVEPVQI